MQVFALGGVLYGTKGKLNVIQTQYFDIIYADESKESAKKIEAVCDSYYLEICSLFETEPYQRFPVTITKSVEEINAYFAAVPYNRIVLFDTEICEGLDNNQKSLETIFYHELTHAVTFGIKSEALKNVSVFADAINPARLSLTTFWEEGATVSVEGRSRADSERGGRLNDPFSTQIVVQAKLDDDFPSWRDVTGARDTYPGGTDAYIFGGEFALYLQNKYGFSKYAQFWSKAGSSLSLSFCAGIFKKTYGISLSDEWKEFKQSLEVPQVEQISSDDSLFNKKLKKSVYSCLELSLDKKTVVWYDRKTASIMRSTFNSKKNEFSKPKKIRAVRGVSKISLSSDGKFMLVSRTVSKENPKAELSLFDLKKGSSFNLARKSVRDGVILLENEDCVKIAAVNVRETPYKITFFNFDKKNHKFTPYDELILQDDEIPFSLVSAEGELSFIIKNALVWSIAEYDSFSKNLKKSFVIDSENPIIMRKLKYAGQNALGSAQYVFSFARIGMSGKMLPRPAIFCDENFMLYTKDISGGVFDTILLSDFKNNYEKLVFFSEHYEYTNLCSILKDENDFEQIPVQSEIFAVKKENSLADEVVTNVSHSSEKNENSLSYSWPNYFKRGIFLPTGDVPLYDFDFESELTSIIGLTFISSNPWGDNLFTFSCGFDIENYDGGFYTSLQKENDITSFNVSGTCVFDKNGFMQTSAQATLEKVISRGYIHSIYGGIMGIGLYGRELCTEEDKKNFKYESAKGYYTAGKTYLTYSNIHKIFSGVYQYGGFSLTPFILTSRCDNDYRIEEDKYINAGLSSTVRLPGIFPLTITANLFPKSEYFASAVALAVLFSHEIHKGIPAISLYAQRFVLTASYSGSIKYFEEGEWDIQRTNKIAKNLDKNNYSDTLRFNAQFVLAPNTGFFASSDYDFGVGASLLYHFYGKNKDKWNVGLYTNLAW